MRAERLVQATQELLTHISDVLRELEESDAKENVPPPEHQELPPRPKESPQEPGAADERRHPTLNERTSEAAVQWPASRL